MRQRGQRRASTPRARAIAAGGVVAVDAERRPLAAVGQLHVVHDDVLVEVRRGSCRAATTSSTSVSDSGIGVDDEVGQHLALGRQHGRVAALPRRQRLDVVGDHAVEEAHAILAGEHELQRGCSARTEGIG